MPLSSKVVVLSIGTLALGATCRPIGVLTMAWLGAQSAADTESQVLEQLRPPARYTIVPEDTFQRLGWSRLSAVRWRS